MARVAPRILIAEDEDRLWRVLAMLLSNAGYKLSLASDGEEALSLFEQQQPDVVVTDVKMPKVDGMELLKKVREQSPETPVIVITAFGSIESAVEAMQAGAIDYITKPFDEERIKLAIERALELRRILSENKFLRTELKHKLNLDTIVAESEAMKSVLQLASEVAGSSATVIVHGESGTGKELVTRFIHLNSARQHGPFVAINCAAIPDNLLESELFGYERGAFTGAVDRKTGKFEQAANGTLFLDEIGELSPNVQAKVLRAIEQREIVRLGGLKAIKIDIRILCATNKDLEEEVRAGRFREDLYYRLSVFP
ncbi:MAG: sigma-54 dependent transcriptional regulator, partial [bacterium]